jgi:hypothetical protein
MAFLLLCFIILRSSEGFSSDRDSRNAQAKEESISLLPMAHHQEGASTSTPQTYEDKITELLIQVRDDQDGSLAEFYRPIIKEKMQSCKEKLESNRNRVIEIIKSRAENRKKWSLRHKEVARILTPLIDTMEITSFDCLNDGNRKKAVKLLTEKMGLEENLADKLNRDAEDSCDAMKDALQFNSEWYERRIADVDKDIKKIDGTSPIELKKILMYIIHYGVLKPTVNEAPSGGSPVSMLEDSFEDQLPKKSITLEKLTQLIRQYCNDNIQFKINNYPQIKAVKEIYKRSAEIGLNELLEVESDKRIYMEDCSLSHVVRAKKINRLIKEIRLTYSSMTKEAFKKLTRIEEIPDSKEKVGCFNRTHKKINGVAITMDALKELQQEEEEAVFNAPLSHDSVELSKKEKIVNAHIDIYFSKIKLYDKYIKKVDNKRRIPLGEALYYLVKSDVWVSASDT